MTRREYKTRWQAEKRRQMRAASSESVTLDLPRAVVRNLRAGKPHGWSFAQYVRRRLMIAFADGRPIPGPKVAGVPVVDRTPTTGAIRFVRAGVAGSGNAVAEW